MTMIHGGYNAIEKSVRDTMAQCPSVLVGYLFGSVRTGQFGPFSDVDVAVLLEPLASSTEVCGQAQDALCRALRTDRVDLVPLATAPSSLAYRVIRDGRCIYCRDRRAREAFESDTVMRYLDFKPIRDRAFQTSRERILEIV